VSNNHKEIWSARIYCIIIIIIIIIISIIIIIIIIIIISIIIITLPFQKNVQKYALQHAEQRTSYNHPVRSFWCTWTNSSRAQIRLLKSTERFLDCRDTFDSPHERWKCTCKIVKHNNTSIDVLRPVRLYTRTGLVVVGQCLLLWQDPRPGNKHQTVKFLLGHVLVPKSFQVYGALNVDKKN
jgi:hypothetical protein